MSVNKDALVELTNTWPDDWSDSTGNIASDPTASPLSACTIKFICEEIQRALENGLGRRAGNWTILAMAFTKGALITEYRFSKLFHPSNFDARKLKKLIQILEQTVAWALRFLPDKASSLSNWLEFARLAAKTQTDESQLLYKARQTRGTLALMLAFVEEAFSNPSSLEDSPILPGQLKHLSREQLASAASFVLAKLTSAPGLTEADFTPAFDAPTLRSATANFLLMAHALNEIRNFEVCVFRFGYRVTYSTGVWNIEAPSQAFGMALNFGYMFTSMQSVEHHRRAIDESSNGMYFSDFCQDVERVYGQLSGPPLYSIVQNPLPGLRLQIRTDEAKILAEQILTKEGVFREEGALIRQNCQELMASVDELMNFHLEADFTVKDFFMAARILRFYGVLRSRELERMKSDDEEMYIHSRVMGGRFVDLEKILAVHGMNPTHINAFMKYASWSTATSEHLDLQYTSIIRVGLGYILLPMTQLNSDLFRNLFSHSKKRIFNSETDPLDSFVGMALSSCFSKQQNVKYKYKSVEGELDVVAFSENTLFVFECKNSLLPCNAFELRSLLDLFDKAVEQLDKITALWEDSEFKEFLGKKLGVVFGPDTVLRTGIVPLSRMLSGIHYKSHPVRQARELKNFVQTGKAFFYAPEQTYTWDMWNGMQFSPALLANYLDEDSDIHAPLHKSAEAISNEIAGNNWKVESKSYALDLNKYFEILDERGLLQLLPDP